MSPRTLHAFLTSAALDLVSGQLHAPTILIPRKDPGTHWIEGWMGPRAHLDLIEKIKITFLPLREIEPRSSSPQLSH